MARYNFKIDKAACFAYWAQALIKWGWRFGEKEREYYLTITGPLTPAENQALEKLKQLLQKEECGFIWPLKLLFPKKDYGFVWLNDRYTGKPIKNHKDEKIWQEIKTNLKDKFEIIWNQESQKLLKWQKILQTYSYEDLFGALSRVEHFFESDVSILGDISVLLCFYHHNDGAAGHTKKGYKNQIMLNLSNLDSEYIYRAILILAHETAHLIEYASKKHEILKSSYMEIFKSKRERLQQDGPAWNYLFVESVIASIATGYGVSNTYMDCVLFPQFQKQPISQRKPYTGGLDYHELIKIAAGNLTDITAEYLDQSKVMDKKYADAVAIEWLRLRDLVKDNS